MAKQTVTSKKNTTKISMKKPKTTGNKCPTCGRTMPK